MIEIYECENEIKYNAQLSITYKTSFKYMRHYIEKRNFEDNEIISVIFIK